MTTDDQDTGERDKEEEPTLLDTEEEEEADKVSSRVLGEGSEINATRDEEVVAKALSADAGSEADEEEDEIESARAELRESEDDEDEDEDPAEEDEPGDSESSVYYQRVIERIDGKPVSRMENLKTHLTGDIVLSVTDRKEGYHFTWKDEALKLTQWRDKAAKNPKCKIEITENDLEQILRGRLNPQVAMLSHKVNVSGDLSHAVYFFNLFSSGRR